MPGRTSELSPEQFGLMESLIGILKPFNVTTHSSAEKSITISYVLHLVLELASVLEAKDSDSVPVSTVKDGMLKDLNIRFNSKPLMQRPLKRCLRFWILAFTTCPLLPGRCTKKLPTR